MERSLLIGLDADLGRVSEALEEFEDENMSLSCLLLLRAESDDVSFLKRDENGDSKVFVEVSEVLLLVLLEGGFAASDVSGSLETGANDDTAEVFDAREDNDGDE